MKRIYTLAIAIAVALPPMRAHATPRVPEPTYHPYPIQPLVLNKQFTPKKATFTPIKQVVYVPPTPKVAPMVRGSSAGNTYVPGNCTWYVKNQRPDLPNGLGDAKYWYSRAHAMGLPTGLIPKVGAVVVTNESYWGHVALVTAVNGATITVSEMNVQGLYVVSSRVLPSAGLRYIY